MNQKNALSCIRYGLEKLLQWDIQDCRKKFDRYTIKLMKMERLVEYIEFPPEIEFGDPKYILSILYPDVVHMNHKELIENMYQRVIDGECQFPREYFLGQNGFYRFSICLCYMISNFCPVYDDVEELYSFFSSPKGRKFLDRYRLKVPMEHLNIDILKSILNITDDDPYSSLYYAYYGFKEEFSGLIFQEPEHMRSILDELKTITEISDEAEELLLAAQGCLDNIRWFSDYELLRAEFMYHKNRICRTSE